MSSLEKEVKTLRAQAAAKAQSEEELPVLGGMKMLMSGGMGSGSYY